jgi:hypothetical protein
MAGPQRTQFAMAALDLASLFNVVVGSEPLPSLEGPSFKVELSAPDGPSTGGGAQSVQHIRLSREGAALVAGSIDPVQKSAELRSYDYVNQLHAQRYKGARMPIDRAAYDALVKRVRDFAKQHDLSVVLKETAPAPVATPAKGGNPAMMVVAILIVLAVAAGAYFMLMKK